MLNTIKIYAFYTVKIYKNNLKHFINGGRRGLRCDGPGSAFAHPRMIYRNITSPLRYCMCVRFKMFVFKN